MNRRTLSLILLWVAAGAVLLSGCVSKEPAILSDPPELPALMSGEADPWKDPAFPAGPEPTVPGATGYAPQEGAEPPADPASPTGQPEPAIVPDPPRETEGISPISPASPNTPRLESPEDLNPPPTEPDSEIPEIPCDLQPVLEKRLEGLEGTWSVYLKNLDTGETLRIHDEPMVAASLIKLYVAGAYYATDPEGNDSDRCDLVSSMLRVSSNEACNTLIDLLGKDNINDFILAQGDTDSRLNRKMLEASAQENYVTADACGKILEALVKETYVSPAASQRMLEDLKKQERTGKLPAGIPGRVQTANKTGELSSVENDVCVVWSEGGTYILCVLSEDLQDTGAARREITEISRLVYTYFTDREPRQASDHS